MAPKQSVPPATEDSALKARLQLMWGLLAFGLICVLVAEPVAREFATTRRGDFLDVDQRALAGWTLKIYVWGAMSFLAGIGERIAFEIAKLKKD